MKSVTLFFKNQKIIMSDIYNLKDNDAKGRSIWLGSRLMASFYDVFITGIFYTGFLSMYDISIEGVGIISYIPLIASSTSIFSSKILERFKKRKKILIASKINFYAMTILATTLMPQFVIDPTARLWCFGILLFLAHSIDSMISPGFTLWFYNFYPKDNERRTRYLTYNQMFSSIMSSAVMMLSSVIADALKGSDFQNQIILIMRYLAFVLVLIDVFMQAHAIEYPYPPSPKIKFRQIFTLPFQYKKFLYCLLMIFAWSFISNLNSGLWNYHLFNHFDLSYTLINSMSVMSTVIFIFTQPFWRGVLRRFSWIKTFGLTCLLCVPIEFLLFLMNPTNLYMYVPLCILQNLILVGNKISYSNILYLNLPSENSTAHFAFYCVGLNLFAFLGSFVGTQLSSITGDTASWFLNMEFYSVQFTALARAITMFILGLLLVIKWRSFTPQKDIEEVEDYANLPKVKYK